MRTEEIEIISEITDIEIIAIGNSIRDLDRLQKKHGRGRWRKLKGLATIRLPDNTTCFAESTGMKRMVLENVTSK